MKEKHFQDKLRALFSRHRTSDQTNGSLPRGSSETLAVVDDVLPDIGPELSLAERVKAMKEVTDRLHGKNIEEMGSVESLWKRVMDLLEDESRHGLDGKIAALCFLTRLVDDHGKECNDQMRAVAFLTIVRTYHVDHSSESLALLSALTENGRNIAPFGVKVGPFLLKVFPDVLRAKEKSEFLRILLTVIKFNAAYLDPPVLTGYMRCLANLCSWTGMESEIEGCLAVLEAVVAYTFMPTEVLEPFSLALCTLVNYRDFCPRAWKIMRDLLGTNLGHAVVKVMVDMLQRNEDFLPDYAPLRGAVFFLSMSLWGVQRVTALKHSPASVLPSLAKVVECDTSLISYEVALSLKRLVLHHGKEQFGPTWDMVFSIVSKLLAFCERKPCQEITAAVHETLTTMELIVTEGNMEEEAVRLYALIEQCAGTRPEKSLFSLLEFWADRITPIRSQWLENLHRIVRTYFKKETRVAVRLRALDVLRRTYADHHVLYEMELVENVILPFLGGVENDESPSVREKAAGLLVNVALNLQSEKFLRVMDILEKIVLRPFSNANKGVMDVVTIVPESEMVDVKVAIDGLTRIFREKLFLPPPEHCIRVYQVLVGHLLLHYHEEGDARKPETDIENSHLLKSTIFECLLSLRADDQYRLGFMEKDGSVKFSPYLMVDHRRGDSHSQGPNSPSDSSSGAASPSLESSSAGVAPFDTSESRVSHCSPYPFCKVLSLMQSCDAFVEGLKKERHWTVLELLLTRLPDVLASTALTSSWNGTDLVDAACGLLKAGANEKLSWSKQVTDIDLPAHVFAVLIALVPYHRHMDPSRQRKLINAITSGLRSDRSASCIDALTMCALEMSGTMHKVIRDVLLRLSTLSATGPIALPVLLFLSTLIRLPGVYKSFTERQYRLIFAVALQYTNPVKFEHSVIKLAHHIIAMWFLKCRLPLRRQLVPYITKALDDNALKTTAAKTDMKSIAGSSTRDGSNRPRSSSMLEQINPDKRGLKPGLGAAVAGQSLLTAQKELAMTCLDLMARYSHAHVFPMPTRSPVGNFLLQHGFSESWVFGNKIITITTSGCSHRPMGPSGLCDHCWTRCLGNTSADKELGESSTSVSAVGPTSPTVGVDCPPRRRHQSEFIVGSPSQTSSHLWNSATKDDLHVGNSGDYVEGAGFSQKPSGSLVKYGRVLCCCHCQGWAEVHIRRPCGSTSWMMKIQNPSMKNRGIGDEAVLGDAMCLMIPSLQERACTVAAEMSMDAPISDASVDQEAAEEREMLTDVDGDAGGRFGLRRMQSSPAIGSPTAVASCPGGMLKPRRSEVDLAALRGIEEEKGWEPLAPFERCVSSSNSSSNPSVRRSSAPLRSVETSPQHRPSSASSQDSPPHASSGHDRQPSNSVKTRAHGASTGRSITATNTCAVNEAPYRERSRTVATAGRTDRPQPRLIRAESLTSGASSVSSTPTGAKDPAERAGISPKFVFLQLFYGGELNSGPDAESVEETTPILLPKSKEVERSLKTLDYVYPFETHKIGVIYVGPGQLDAGQASEELILTNPFGSPRYIEFMEGLGEIIRLPDVDPSSTFLGGLVTTGADGDYAITWKDDLMQVIFHVATLMPTTESDPKCIHKKKHIGNDFVLIIFNESGVPYDVDVVKGRVIQSWVEIQPLPRGCNKVIVHNRSTLEATLSAEGQPAPIISDRNLSLYARQVALHADLLCSSYLEAAGNSAHSSKWLERLRQIRRLRARVWEERQREESTGGNSGGSFNKNESSVGVGQSNVGASSAMQRRRMLQRVSSFTDFV